jgi:D-psicose/D-tagatose/L-ribulose 3-epimerase
MSTIAQSGPCFGVNLLLLGDSVNAGILRQFSRIRTLGFDGVEVPVFAPETVNAKLIRAAAERYGLRLTVSGALPPGTRFYGRDRAVQRRAAAYVHACIRVAHELGAHVICGPLYKAVGDIDESIPLEQQRRATAAAFAPIARAAQDAGVVLAFEPINRFETNFMNTVDQGIAFCRSIGSPAAGLLLDTFHMHIEEKDSAAAIGRAAAAGVLAHFHASENDRGVAGSGQVHWSAVAAAVRRARYRGWVVLESFAQTNQAIRTAVSCWRPFYPSATIFLREGLRFARQTFAGRMRH